MIIIDYLLDNPYINLIALISLGEIEPSKLDRDGKLDKPITTMTKSTKTNSNGTKTIKLTKTPISTETTSQTLKTKKKGYSDPTQRTTPIHPILDGKYEYERPINKRTSSDYGRKLTSDITNQFTHHLQENGRILRDYLNRTYSTRPIQNIDFNISQGKLFIFSPYFPMKRLITDLGTEIDPKQFEENHKTLITSIESPSTN